ncbi:cyclopropane-fatty-acyl-phospholipid synthase [Flexivirga endophytica]|uniref:Cyclopropane-fatty-acyl-phospholipid synthase n=1 Tax=Flexivirga endophytica TaxID=1849103 RepID=A0A916WX72_9MICO|nr:cyclopropane-fatty-acyl-phospholipid synthase family protein [Flexivirga endophytica]GGB39468.1 cyclopropane-fatty-acyl-phospholipid synthase [Flexivirga endophytica]GHB47390.1 cyclopropane-fatty-acyl-phospholipid synthase [Flexivirga endophytica]
MTLNIGEIADRIFGTDVPFAVKAFDGSRGGNPNAVVTIDIASEKALRYLVTAPGELGLARAYIMGDLIVEGIDPGDPYDFLSLFLDDFSAKRPPATELVEVLKSLGFKSFRVPELPDQETVPQWRRAVEGLRHSRKRDAEAIHHHYDVSNEFYELVLGPSMAYTCACYPSGDATLEHAQEHKFDLVCKKLGLQPGMRLLDIGCGWGGMVKHAVEHYGVTALGVTLSAEQASWAQQNLKVHGLDDRAEVRHGDYRDITETGFDAVSSIGLTEHIGVKNYPSYFKFSYDKLKVGGRMLNHSITRPDNKAPALTRGGFINRYVFPDGEITGVGTIVSRMQDQGFEIRHSEDLREHYARTTRKWCKNLSANWDECVRDAGEQVSRVWGLYLAGSSIGFERNHIQLHQVLGEKIASNGQAAYPLRPDFGV